MCYSKNPDPTTTHDQNPDRPPASPAPAWGICENMLGDTLHMFGDVEGTHTYKWGSKRFTCAMKNKHYIYNVYIFVTHYSILYT